MEIFMTGRRDACILRSVMSEPVTPPAASQRLVSLDVLRGFDMFWILGMEEVGMAIAKASNAPWAKFVGHHLDHAPWAGFHFLDLIFPMFVFISGMSVVFSSEKAVATFGRSGAAWKIVKRAVILYLLGVFIYGGLAGVSHPDPRWRRRAPRGGRFLRFWARPSCAVTICPCTANSSLIVYPLVSAGVSWLWPGGRTAPAVFLTAGFPNLYSRARNNRFP